MGKNDVIISVMLGNSKLQIFQTVAEERERKRVVARAVRDVGQPAKVLRC